MLESNELFSWFKYILLNLRYGTLTIVRLSCLNQTYSVFFARLQCTIVLGGIWLNPATRFICCKLHCTVKTNTLIRITPMLNTRRLVKAGRQSALHGCGLGCLSSLLLQERGAGEPSLTGLNRRFPEEPWVGLPAGRGEREVLLICVTRAVRTGTVHRRVI